MAGYKRVGSEDFINATTFNKQIEKQREAYLSRNENSGSLKGIYKSSNIFLANNQEVLQQAFDTFEALDIEYNPTSTDFNVDFSSKINFNYKDTVTMFDNIEEQIDMPNLKGPNLIIPPDLDTFAVPTPNRVDTNFKNKGFGWRDERNNPGSEASTLGSYFKTHYSLGTSNKPPVFGEANDQGNDVINYTQP